jgi:hypothetical protein
MSATFVSFDCFPVDVGLKKHNLNTDQLNLFLTNSAPNVATHLSYGAGGGTELAGITVEHGYDVADSQNLWSGTGGTGTMTGTDVIWTASGGSFGPFRYVVLYNYTSAGKELIAYWDYGSSITCLTGETFTWDVGASVLTLVKP